jgi:hypothetical protein
MALGTRMGMVKSQFEPLIRGDSEAKWPPSMLKYALCEVWPSEAP